MSGTNKTRPESVYTPQQAAVIAGVNLQTLKNAVSRRSLPEGMRVVAGRGQIDRSGVLAVFIVRQLAPEIEVPVELVYKAIKADPQMRETKEIKPGVVLDFGKIASRVAERMDDYDRAVGLVSTDPAIMGGAPCIAGSRIPVHQIARYLKHGETTSSLRKLYPSLTKEQIEAARLYAEANPLRGKPRRRA